MIFFSLLNLGLNYLQTKDGLIDFFSHLFLVHNLSGRTFYSINPSFWSLALEMQLYFIYPVFLMIRKRIGIRKTFLFLILFSLILLFIGELFGQLNSKLWYANSVFKTWFVWGAGAFLAEKYVNRKLVLQGNLLKSAVLFVALIASKYVFFTSSLALYISTFAWLLFFEWFIANDTIHLKGCISKTMIMIGICSYSIYLIHQPLLEPFLTFLKNIPGNYPFNSPELYLGLTLIPIFIVISLVSYLLYKYIEIPSVKLGSKIRSKIKPALEPAR